MKRTAVALLASLLLLALYAPSFGGGIPGNGSRNDADHRNSNNLLDYSAPANQVIDAVSGAVEEIYNDLNGSGRGGYSTSCVAVSLMLPDTVHVTPMHHMPVLGAFQLVNCGDSASLVTLVFQVTLHINDVLDTTITFRVIHVPMAPGDTITHPIRIPVPPMPGTYTFCATAVSGEFSATSCKTMTVVGDPFPGIPTSMCGVLVQGTGCVILSPMGCMQQGGFVLDNYGTFVVGDTVCVDGLMFPHCEGQCPEAHGCIRDNTISTPPSNPGGPFEACGTLVQGTDCVLFAPAGNSSRLIALQNYGPFVVGDSVCVHGMLDPDCQLPCAEATACLANNTIDPWQHNPGNHYQGCGVLVQGTACVVFVAANDPNARFVLQNYGPFVVGDSVCVTGMVRPDCPNMCPEAVACLVMNDIRPTTPPTPGFNGCGFLVQGTNCVLFSQLGMGGMGGHKFVLENYGSFVVGDSVCVSGTLQAPCPGACVEAMGCINGNTINGFIPPPATAPTMMSQNFPNPFNPTTTIFFAVPQTGEVKVAVYNSLGQVVRILSENVMSAGNHQVTWDGRDNRGNQVSSGVYFYKIDAGGMSETRKMLLMK